MSTISLVALNGVKVLSLGKAIILGDIALRRLALLGRVCNSDYAGPSGRLFVGTPSNMCLANPSRVLRKSSTRCDTSIFSSCCKHIRCYLIGNGDRMLDCGGTAVSTRAKLMAAIRANADCSQAILMETGRVPARKGTMEASVGVAVGTERCPSRMRVANPGGLVSRKGFRCGLSIACPSRVAKGCVAR